MPNLEVWLVDSRAFVPPRRRFLLPLGDSSQHAPLEDALWWAAETITTVGYGDKFPVTSEGRMLGVLLMVSGVSLIGAYTGFVAFWFLKPLENQRNAEIEKLLAEVGRYRDAEVSLMRSEIESLRAERDRPTGEPRANL